MMMMTNTRKIVKSRVSGFSRAKLEAGRAYVQLGISLKLVSVCFQGLSGRSRRVRRRFVPESREISLRHPYIERLPTL